MTDVSNIESFIDDLGLEDVTIFRNPDFADAFLGVSTTGQAVYSYDAMVQSMMGDDGMESEEDAMEFIGYNTLRAMEYIDNPPIVIECEFKREKEGGE